MRLVFLLWAAAGLALAQGRAVVLRPVLNMFSKPTSMTDVVTQARYGMTVTIVETRANWTRIKTPDDYPGWAAAIALHRLKKDEPGYAEKGRVATVESVFAHIYREDSVTKHAPVVTVPFETRLEVLDDHSKERWLQVKLADGRDAWIQKGDVTLEPHDRTISDLAELAKRFLGLPYTWGGTTSFGYDCSGFTQMLTRQSGTSIPRDADQQAMWSGMQPVEKADLQAGDLLYFGKSLEKASHTGFYLGNGEFIHASTHEHPVVQISKLDEEHWTSLFVGARRWKK